ncbi:hypothetical protein ColLi_00838 [Colletotrichum liriopes]|uniref:Uncharacterized protein n=1 Tax=Colletotrichum liriopes TaxID=708192 RepID=A0AA37GC88_9PEZI|nr:hypothetical protein ColLi_00838 [Colletotrichum liriopes]
MSANYANPGISNAVNPSNFGYYYVTNYACVNTLITKELRGSSLVTFTLALRKRKDEIAFKAKGVKGKI